MENNTKNYHSLIQYWGNQYIITYTEYEESYIKIYWSSTKSYFWPLHLRLNTLPDFTPPLDPPLPAILLPLTPLIPPLAPPLPPPLLDVCFCWNFFLLLSPLDLGEAAGFCLLDLGFGVASSSELSSGWSKTFQLLRHSGSAMRK